MCFEGRGRELLVCEELIADVGRPAQIVIEKLTKNVTEAHISEIFSAYGDIKVVDMPLNRQCRLLLYTTL